MGSLNGFKKILRFKIKLQKYAVIHILCADMEGYDSKNKYHYFVWIAASKLSYLWLSKNMPLN